jgi:hypothetical protein
MPLRIGTTLKADFWVDQERVTTSATIRTHDPGVGMGIEFTGLTDEAKKRFQAFLDKIDPGISALAHRPSE